MGTFISLTALAANWRLYSSFDNNPLRIIDSPEHTYFLTHQQYYQKNYGGYSFPTLALFEWDKADPEAGITPLVARVPLSEADIRLADYSPAGDYLFVAYNSGTIDLVTPEGEVTSIDILKRSHVPGGSMINSVTFDCSNGDAWVATDGGYLHIDAATKRVSDRATFSKPVKWIAPVGETLVAIIDDRIYHCESLSPRSSDEFSMMQDPVSPLTLMPLSDKEFAYLSGAKGGNVSVIAAKKNGSGWSFR
ncbi:MAG: hypothetical protein K2K97_10410, partial [Muribaculaceae bacterium]|nr:hypothetical protein [Muribaculaceae bacterium]